MIEVKSSTTSESLITEEAQLRTSEITSDTDNIKNEAFETIVTEKNDLAVSTTGSILSKDKSEDNTESVVYQSSIEEKSEDMSGVVRDVSSDSFGFEETKSEEVDELLLVVMPPGHAKIDMRDNIIKKY